MPLPHIEIDTILVTGVNELSKIEHLELDARTLCDGHSFKN